MEMVTVVARETFPYDGITRYCGEAFKASSEDARILGLAQLIDLANDTPQSVPSAEPPSDEPRRTTRRRSREQADEA